jgi:hypothetical protein
VTTIDRIARDISDDVHYAIQNKFERLLEQMVEEGIEEAIAEMGDDSFADCDNIVNGLTLTLPPLDPEFIRGVKIGVAMMEDAKRGELKEFWVYERA